MHFKSGFKLATLYVKHVISGAVVERDIFWVYAAAVDFAIATTSLNAEQELELPVQFQVLGPACAAD
jgi:hypothetical protein